MPSMTSIVALGNLTCDPQTKATTTGKTVTNIRLAINYGTGDNIEVSYINVIAWDKLGENSAKYLHKGDSALVKGRFRVREYTNKDNMKVIVPEIVATDVVFLRTQSSDRNAPSSYNNGGNSSYNAGNNSTSSASYRQHSSSKPVSGNSGDDADIPF